MTSRFESTIALHAAGETVRRDPSFWDKVKRAFGAKLELDTERVHTHLTTAHLVGAVKVVLRRMGVSNAVSLVIDGHVLFEDRDGKDDDFDDLFLAFYAHEGRFGQEFRELRLSFEHLDAGMHLAIVVVAHGVHDRNDATARVIVTAEAVAPRPSASVAWAQRRRFEAFVASLREVLAEALPDVRVRWSAQPSLTPPAPKSASAPRPKGYGDDGGSTRGDLGDASVPLDVAPEDVWRDDPDAVGDDARDPDEGAPDGLVGSLG